MDYHFQIACVQPPPPQRKNREKGCLWGRGDCTQHSALLMRFGSGSERVFFSDTPPKCLDRDCVGRRRTGTRHGDVYRSVREKQGNVVYRQRVLQTVTSLRVVSLVFRGHDLLKIANINSQQEALFRYRKNKFPEIAAEMEPRSWSTPSRLFA